MGDFFDLDFTSVGSGSSGPGLRSAFAQQFNSNGDRGNSDFDQRQNLFSARDLAAERQAHADAGLEGFLDGRLPLRASLYVLSPTCRRGLWQQWIENQRANLIGSVGAGLSSPPAAPGGMILLTPRPSRSPPAAASMAIPAATNSRARAFTISIFPWPALLPFRGYAKALA